MTENIVNPSTLASVKRYAILAYGGLGTMLDVGLMVLGSLLVGLSLAVLLAGFEIVDVVQELATAPLLISALVLAVAGLFCLGVASEGPLGRGRRLAGFKLWEVGIGRIFAVFIVGFGAILLYRALSPLVDGLPSPILKGLEGVRAVGVAGMIVMPLIGVPLSLLARSAPIEQAWIHKTDIPLMFVVWVIAAIVTLT